MFISITSSSFERLLGFFYFLRLSRFSFCFCTLFSSWIVFKLSYWLSLTESQVSPVSPPSCNFVGGSEDARFCCGFFMIDLAAGYTMALSSSVQKVCSRFIEITNYRILMHYFLSSNSDVSPGFTDCDKIDLCDFLLPVLY